MDQPIETPAGMPNSIGQHGGGESHGKFEVIAQIAFAVAIHCDIHRDHQRRIARLQRTPYQMFGEVPMQYVKLKP